MGLSMEGNLCFKINWATLTVGRKFTSFALFYFVFDGNFQAQAPMGLILILEGQFNRGFFGLRVGGLIHGRAYFQNFTVCQRGLHLHERKKIVRKKDSADKLPSCCKQTSEHPKNLSQP